MEKEWQNGQERDYKESQNDSPDALAEAAVLAENRNIASAAPEMPETENSLDVEDILEVQQEIKADQTQDKTPESMTKVILSYLRDFVFLLSGVVLIFTLLFRVVVVSGPSMKNTLYNGDYILLLNNVLYTEPQYGDIIVACKDTFHDGEPIIKRIIAVEGQTVDIDFVQGIVYVDGVALDEPYTNTPTNIEEGVTFPQVVPEGCVFVMGDNRNASKDSRSLEIGMIDKREILGKALFLVFPGQSDQYEERDFSRIGVLW